MMVQANEYILPDFRPTLNLYYRNNIPQAFINAYVNPIQLFDTVSRDRVEPSKRYLRDNIY